LLQALRRLLPARWLRSLERLLLLPQGFLVGRSVLGEFVVVLVLGNHRLRRLLPVWFSELGQPVVRHRRHRQKLLQRSEQQLRLPVRRR